MDYGVLQVEILNPKAKRILDDLADLRLISIREEEGLFVFSDAQKKSIEVSRKQLKSGKYKSNKRSYSGPEKMGKRKIVWTHRSEQEFKSILEFYIEQNESAAYYE